MTILDREHYFANGLFTPPSELLPETLRDAEGDHLREDEALWQFVAIAYQLAEDGYLRKQALTFLEWDKKNLDRTLWYA